MKWNKKLNYPLIFGVSGISYGHTSPFNFVNFCPHTSEYAPIFFVLSNKTNVHCIFIDGCFHGDSNNLVFIKVKNYLVARAGLEPARPYGQQILSLVRLPFRHLAKKFRVI